MKYLRVSALALISLAAALLSPSRVHAVVYDFSVDGSDAIFLAGRTDVVVAPLGNPFILARHGYVNADFVQETHPGFVSVSAGDILRVADPGVGGIDFFNGTGNFFGPEGNVGPVSSLTSLGGISGWLGTQGALAGVFLDDSIPNAGPAPATLDFSTEVGRDFASLSPVLGQVFFIGDGLNSLNQFQEFVAPAGATRLFVGIPDGFNFNGPPGAYEDNDGSYRIRIGVNERPDVIPEPGTMSLMAAAFGPALVLLRRRKTA